MNNTGRMTYSSKEAAVAGAIKQIESIEIVGVVESIEAASARRGKLMEKRMLVEKNHRELMSKLRGQNNERIEVRELTSDDVYPTRKI